MKVRTKILTGALACVNKILHYSALRVQQLIAIPDVSQWKSELKRQISGSVSIKSNKTIILHCQEGKKARLSLFAQMIFFCLSTEFWFFGLSSFILVRGITKNYTET